MPPKKRNSTSQTTPAKIFKRSLLTNLHKAQTTPGNRVYIYIYLNTGVGQVTSRKLSFKNASRFCNLYDLYFETRKNLNYEEIKNFFKQKFTKLAIFFILKHQSPFTCVVFYYNYPVSENYTLYFSAINNLNN